MNNNDERDYSEEADNQRLIREDEDFWRKADESGKTDEEHNRRIADENRESTNWWNFGHPSDLLTNYRTMDESAQEVEDRADADIQEQNYRDAADATILDEPLDWSKVEEWRESDETPLPVGYGDEWDGSATNQSNDFFIGHNGHVTTLWQITNNPYEKYDPSKSYHLPARDGSALYVWCNLQMSDSDAIRSIRETSKLLTQLDTNITSIRYISE